MDKGTVMEAVRTTGIIAILRGVPVDAVVPAAEALYAGGIRALEVTGNTPGCLESIRRLRANLGRRMLIGAGTVVNPAMAQLVLDAGAQFVLAPDLNPAVVAAVHEQRKLIIPGVATPSEILQACRLGVDMLKLFPAGALGVRYLKELGGPLDGLRIIPVGGVDLGNTKAFAEAGAAAVGVGGALVDSSAVASGQYEVLTERAAAFAAAFREGRPQPAASPSC
ncbi:bifunctional 4-hydroxy-2-oxoglutarate aldolase/2-dehydro-3-deoxy-phosphogluconate aldolase [Paenibacillus caseinilyticus]|uniref:2-dehydro-3-deoxyphosphogluconate aldolase n=1 Tax=Paenibacillus mucilaginosus K02 TaxID=997761 RepID=I0BLN1_9BACL|nr:bifunctional 4-hydroxy-2-oxoglutarate aldolase/2-dehydro-3-deoxy-phosphogluconate aldolase [Paenibacillus mucilaginosus]AFH63278.1 2-dehydro-3-deoxyphosphogluconate aldolase [Paenibacillus mucilaginosus K02]